MVIYRLVVHRRDEGCFLIQSTVAWIDEGLAARERAPPRPPVIYGAPFSNELVQVVIVQGHNHNPMDYLRLNEQPSVVRELWKLDWDVGQEILDTCSVRKDAPGLLMLLRLFLSLLFSVFCCCRHYF